MEEKERDWREGAAHVQRPRAMSNLISRFSRGNGWPHRLFPPHLPSGRAGGEACVAADVYRIIVFPLFLFESFFVFFSMVLLVCFLSRVVEGSVVRGSSW